VGTAAGELHDLKAACHFAQRVVVNLEPDGGAVFFELTGPAGTRDFVSALIYG